MAFLAPTGYPVVDTPAQTYVDPFAESRSFSFRSLDGTAILPFTGAEFIAMWGTENLDVPAREMVEDDSPNQDGSNLAQIRIGSRSWALPIFCGSDSGHLPYLRNRARMRSFFSHRGVDYRAARGTFDLVASSVLGDRALRAAYVDGMNGSWDQASTGSHFETFGLRALSVDPYWYGDRWVTPKITRPTGYKWFGQFPPVLSSSRTLGSNITITVTGDANSYARINLTGYAPSALITGPGLYVSIPAGLAAGESAVIDTDPRNRVALFGGVLDWTRVAPQRQFAAMVPGDNVFNVDLGNAGPGASAVVSGPSLWETPW